MLLTCRSVQSIMDRRSWPWKKKSSDKAAAEKAIATLESAGAPSAGSQGDQVCSSTSLHDYISFHNFSCIWKISFSLMVPFSKFHTIHISYIDNTKEFEPMLYLGCS